MLQEFYMRSFAMWFYGSTGTNFNLNVYNRKSLCGTIDEFKQNYTKRFKKKNQKIKILITKAKSNFGFLYNN